MMLGTDCWTTLSMHFSASTIRKDTSQGPRGLSRATVDCRLREPAVELGPGSVLDETAAWLRIADRSRRKLVLRLQRTGYWIMLQPEPAVCLLQQSQDRVASLDRQCAGLLCILVTDPSIRLNT